MATRNDLVEEVLRNLSAPNDMVGVVATTAGAADTEIVVNGGMDGLEPGVFEVGSELVFAQGVDTSAGVLTNVTRGYLGTTAASQAAGTVVRRDPATPRVDVMRALNNTLNDLHPRLFAVVETQFPSVGATAAYDLPAATVDVLRVAITEPGLPSVWTPSRRWRFVPAAPTASVTGRVLLCFDFWSGSDIHVVYSTAPGVFSEATATNEAFTTATGLPEWCREVVTLGAAYRLANFMDQEDPVPVANQVTQPPSPQKLAAHLYAMFSQRLDAAELRLRAENDIGGVHYMG